MWNFHLEAWVHGGCCDLLLVDVQLKLIFLVILLPLYIQYIYIYAYKGFAILQLLFANMCFFNLLSSSP